MPYRLKEMKDLRAQIRQTEDMDSLITLRRHAHDIWREEHNFGTRDKEARSLYNDINVKIDKERLAHQQLRKNSRRIGGV
jgi:hypothetical protein